MVSGDNEAALRDLDEALASPDLTADVEKQALAQRGILKRLAGDDEGAWRDFDRAGKMGNAFAKREAVRLNPYAALCNQMLQEAAHQLVSPADSSPTGQ